MKSSIDCIPCFIRQALDAGKMTCPDETVVVKILKRVLLSVAEFDISLTPPQMAQVVHRVIREETGNKDPYYNLKKKSTKRAIAASLYAREVIGQSDFPFEMAVRFAIAGNILDFGARSDWDESIISRSFENAISQPLDSNIVAELFQVIENSSTVLVLGDNAGETVFDKLLIENFPSSVKVYYAVKGSPIINDATIDDAISAGVDQNAQIVSNGTDIPGTVLEQCSDEFLEIFNTVDVVVSKGQGNFETLSDCKRNVFFLLQIKCNVIASRYDLKLGDWVVTSSDNLRNRKVMQCV